MPKIAYVDYSNTSCGISGSKLGISGARFSLSPMSDDFIEIILGALDKTDTSNLWTQTDNTSTVYRGQTNALFDALKAFYINAYRNDVHMSMNLTLSKGCPGDTDADYLLEAEDKKINEDYIKDKHFDITGKFSLYIFGDNNYMSEIETVVNRGIDMGVISGTGHYVTFLNADVHDIFSYLADIYTYLENKVSHFVIEAQLLCNLPEKN